VDTDCGLKAASWQQPRVYKAAAHTVHSTVKMVHYLIRKERRGVAVSNTGNGIRRQSKTSFQTKSFNALLREAKLLGHSCAPILLAVNALQQDVDRHGLIVIVWYLLSGNQHYSTRHQCKADINSAGLATHQVSELNCQGQLASWLPDLLAMMTLSSEHSIQ